MFARYKGAKSGLTEGKVYIAKPQIEDNSMVGLGHLDIQDDDGKIVQIHPEDKTSGQFEFLGEIYAVVIEPFDGFVVGDVVVLSDATDSQQGILYNVKGSGYRDSASVCILDRTNVYPGVVVMEISTGNWVKVRMVDEALWVRVDDSESMRSPEEFRFAVSDGGIMSEPVIRCLDASGEPSLTVGRYYVVQKTIEAFGCVVVKNDIGILATYMDNRFQIGG